MPETLPGGKQGGLLDKQQGKQVGIIRNDDKWSRIVSDTLDQKDNYNKNESCPSSMLNC